MHCHSIMSTTGCLELLKGRVLKQLRISRERKKSVPHQNVEQAESTLNDPFRDDVYSAEICVRIGHSDLAKILNFRHHSGKGLRKGRNARFFAAIFLRFFGHTCFVPTLNVPVELHGITMN
jgi:hypothetical protein